MKKLDADDTEVQENIIWQSRPSQLKNIFVFITLWWTMIIPLITYLQTRYTVYILTNERIKLRKGIVTIRINEVELYRVRDYQILKPILMRIFGLGNIVLITSDKTQRRVYFKAIRDVENVATTIRKYVELNRNRTGTREVDFT